MCVCFVFVATTMATSSLSPSSSKVLIPRLSFPPLPPTTTVTETEQKQQLLPPMVVYTYRDAVLATGLFDVLSNGKWVMTSTGNKYFSAFTTWGEYLVFMKKRQEVVEYIMKQPIPVQLPFLNMVHAPTTHINTMKHKLSIVKALDLYPITDASFVKTAIDNRFPVFITITRVHEPTK